MPAPGEPLGGITDVTGVRVGHWTDTVGRTGCTVVVFPPGTLASAEVRGGAPATRELDVLAPGRLVEHIDVAVLTGGSAFGLAAADGAMRWCEEQGLGFPTGAGPVPIVPALALYDLAVGDPAVRPGPDEGYAACAAATTGPVAIGAVGAGTGATVGKWRGGENIRPGGVGSAAVRRGDLVVGALVAVNAFGDIDVDGQALERAADVDWPTAPHFGNTTIGVIATNGRLTKQECLLVAQSGHDAIGRTIVPAHTRVDGEALIAAATGSVGAPPELVRMLAALALERAVRSLA